MPILNNLIASSSDNEKLENLTLYSFTVFIYIMLVL